MRRLARFLVPLVFCALPVANADTAADGTPARADNLEGLRSDSAQGKWADALALCDRLAAIYDAQRDLHPPQSADWYLSSRMVGYCQYLKAQVLALRGDLPEADKAFADAEAYRSKHSETQNAKLTTFWQELDLLTDGLILEKEGKLDAAVQAYAQVANSPKASSRLALLEFNRGRADQAKTWALIHADDPTSQYVLAQLAAKAKNLAAARQHVERAWNQLTQAQAAGQEYEPLYFCEMPRITALRASLRNQPAGGKPATPSGKTQ